MHQPTQSSRPVIQQTPPKTIPLKESLVNGMQIFKLLPRKILKEGLGVVSTKFNTASIKWPLNCMT